MIVGQVSLRSVAGEGRGRRQSGEDPRRGADDPQRRERRKNVPHTPDAAVAGDDEALCHHLTKQQTK